jgi:alkylation response protein AidB-like acyl-CoA dehydrogenase
VNGLLVTILPNPDAGSDANAGKTKAILSEDGEHYEISGQKIWISNAGFAQVFIVFARIEDDKNITGFIFEKDKVEGLTLNPEEAKLGIPIFLNTSGIFQSGKST